MSWFYQANPSSNAQHPKDNHSKRGLLHKVGQRKSLLNYLIKNKFHKNFEIDNNKTALVIGAGPSLEESIKFLKENNDNIFIISTDTSYPTLLKHKIIPQVVVSIDAQIFSREHFIGINKEIIKNTIFLFDLCANSSIIKKLKNEIKRHLDDEKYMRHNTTCNSSKICPTQNSFQLLTIM